MTLVEFLTVRLDEAEAAAKRVHQPYRLYVCDDGHVEEPMRVSDLHGPHDGEYEQWSAGDDRLPNHHNSWLPIYDPARVLAEVDAKRRIVALHEVKLTDSYGDEQFCDTCGTGKRDWGPGSSADFYPTDWPCLTLRLLALPYADHPDYDEAWRP